MHPLFFPKLLMFMKMKCLACHDFRLPKRQSKVFCAKLHLVDGGRVKEAMALDEEMSSVTLLSGGGKLNETAGASSKDREARREQILASAKVVDELLDRKLALPPLPDAKLTAHERGARRKILKEFQSACTKQVKCANCQAFSPKVRHDQFNKLFRVALSERNRKNNLAERIRIRQAVKLVDGVVDGMYGGVGGESDDDDAPYVDSEDEIMGDDDDDRSIGSARTSLIDDEAVDDDEDGTSRKKKKKQKFQKEKEKEEDADPTRVSRKATVSTEKVAGGTKQDKFMSVIEVEAQCKLTWEKQPFLCCKYFGSAHVGDDGDEKGSSYPNYVTEDEDNSNGTGNRAVRSSSPAKGKGYSIFFLRAVPVPPSRFRPPVLMGQMQVEHSQNYYLSKVLELNARLRNFFSTYNDLGAKVRDLKSSLGEEGVAKQLSKLKAEQDRVQANQITTWVDLQTTVNCFMDSSRDPAGTAASAPPGIRQVLEKKEGMFRKHMMGKRVNFACRSVISPDPYIGTNEIGLPLHFAKTLTFPTPVTSFNVTEMQVLVRRGAEYPGATWVEFPNGSRVDLGKMKERGRNAIAARLLSSGSGSAGVVKVGRQLRDGDMVLMNRQVRKRRIFVISVVQEKCFGKRYREHRTIFMYVQ